MKMVCAQRTAVLPSGHRAPSRAPASFCRSRILYAPQHASRDVATKAVATPAPAINITETALQHLQKLRTEKGATNLLLRIGVRQGGCSGMSYHMDFETPENVRAEDAVMDYDNGAFKIVCDPKSLLYLFGMRLDFSDALIGGGFQFSNPNATDTCGCGKSFGV